MIEIEVGLWGCPPVGEARNELRLHVLVGQALGESEIRDFGHSLLTQKDVPCCKVAVENVFVLAGKISKQRHLLFHLM